MILVIAALLVTGLIGTSLIKMATSDRMGGIHFSNSVSARSAAKSGLTAALMRIGSANVATRDSILTILNTYAKAANADTLSNYKMLWICGGPNSAPVDSQWKSLSPGSLEKFRTRIDAFNKTTFEITLVSEGVGLGGSRSAAIGVYRLSGLGRTASTDWGDQNAIDLEDDCALDLRGPITINGDSRFSKDVDFDEWTSGSVFNGRFTSQSSNSGTMIFKGKFTFKKSAFFGSIPDVQALSTPIAGSYMSYLSLEGKSGFPFGSWVSGGTFGIDASADIRMSSDTSDSYWGGAPIVRNSGYKEFYRLNNNKIYSRFTPIFTSAAAINPGTITSMPGMTESTIKTALRMPPPCPYTVNIGVIPDDKKVIVNTLKSSMTAKDFEQIRTDNMDKVWNGFTVIEVVSGGYMEVVDTDVDDNSGSSILSKFIVIVSGDGKFQPTSGGKSFSVNVTTSNLANSGHFTLICNGGTIQNIGGWNQFRGLFYSKSGTFCVGGSSNSVENVYGSIYAKTGSVLRWYPKFPTSNAFITFDQTVFTDLDVEGQEDPASTTTPKNKKFLTRSCGSAPSSSTDIVLTGSRIVPRIYSLGM